MILSNAQDLIYNGASVNSVWYNQTKIWPTSAPGPQTWSAVGYDTLHTASSKEKLGNTVCFNCTGFTGYDSSILSTYNMYVHSFTNPFTGYTSFTGSSINTNKTLKKVYIAYSLLNSITSNWATSNIITGFLSIQNPLTNASGLWASAICGYNWGSSPTGNSGVGNTFWAVRAAKGLKVGKSYYIRLTVTSTAKSAKFASWATTGASSRTATAFGSASKSVDQVFLSWTASGEY